jgi:hypothetical protein
MSAPRIATTFLVGLAVAVILVSGSFGRAHPTGNYRPDLPAAALTNGCWPLPTGVVFDFPHQVRTDADIGDPPRRHLVLQFDVIDVATARERVADAFRSAGFEQSGSAGAERLVFEKPGFGTVSAEVTPLAGAAGEYVVRGTIVLDLPSSAPLTHDPACDQTFSTKRFAADAAES